MELDWRGSAEADLAGIGEEALQAEIAAAIVDLVEEPSLGERLRHLPEVGDLSDCRKLYVDLPADERPPGPKRYRIVYRLLPREEAVDRIEIIAIGPRGDLLAYRRAVVRLGRPPGRRIL